MNVRSLNGEEMELLAISYCPRHGNAPHHVGDHGSLSCAPCAVYEESRYRRVYGTTREAS